MKFSTNFLLVSFLFLAVSSMLNAQQTIPEGTEKIIIDGQTFYLHKVRKSEGLYRISVSYGVSQKEILEVNPSAVDGLKEGQILKVPVIKGRNSTKDQLESEEFIYHTVEEGQTAYYISKRYKVELEEIYQNNPGSDQQLILGTIIKIPKKELGSTKQENSNEDYIIHKVEPKETIYALSKKYDVTISDIIAHNEGLESGVLPIGSFIRIPKNKEVEEAPLVTDEIDGTEDSKYIYHKIKTGETLYSISARYNAKPNEVQMANGSVNASDLPLGYLVRIPKSSIKKSKHHNEFESAVLIDHKIRKREDLYDIVDKYGVPAEMIEKVNETAGIDLSRWRKGLVIKVPTKKWVEQYYESAKVVNDDVADDKLDETVLAFEKKECDAYDYSITKPSIKVAIILPFNVEATKRMNLEKKVVNNDTIYVESDRRKLSMRSKVFVEFYQGALLALDALKQEGVNVDMFVYDSAPDTFKVKQILQKPELKHVDLIIGPAYSSSLDIVSDFSKQHNIPMVYPLSTNNKQMNHNPLLFQANPIDTLVFDVMARRVMQDARGHRLIMIRTENDDNEFEQNMSQLIRDKVYWESFKNGEVPDFVEYKFKQDDLASLERMFDKNKKNTILIPSVEEAQVNRIISTLKGAVEKTKADVTLWGLPDWMKYNTVNPEDIHKLNGHIFSYYAVDYTDEDNNAKVSAYRHWFKTEPIAISPYFQTASVQSNISRYSLWGHDVTYYFISALRDYGKDFTHCIQHHKPMTIQSNFNFYRVSNWGGFYNHGLFILKFSPDYNMQIEELK